MNNSDDKAERASSDAEAILVSLAGDDLTRIDLAGANLAGVDLSRKNLSGANLRGADLTNARLGHATLTKACLAGANLRGATLRSADLSEVNLQGADVSGADLRESNLKWTDLDGANLSGADLRDARVEETDLATCNLGGIQPAALEAFVRDFGPFFPDWFLHGEGGEFYVFGGGGIFQQQEVAEGETSVTVFGRWDRPIDWWTEFMMMLDDDGVWEQTLKYEDGRWHMEDPTYPYSESDARYLALETLWPDWRYPRLPGGEAKQATLAELETLWPDWRYPRDEGWTVETPSGPVGFQPDQSSFREALEDIAKDWWSTRLWDAVTIPGTWKTAGEPVGEVELTYRDGHWTVMAQSTTPAAPLEREGEE
ncbi:MAG: pentapeptide repeat-containing protein [Chloroflexi bacterium]|nr:pentapeptide repeat-containing protein [Chloroflexota bacterium]